MPIKTLGVEDWAQEIIEPLPTHIEKSDSSRPEEPLTMKEVTVRAMPSGYGPSLVHSFLQHIHKDPTGGATLPAELVQKGNEMMALREELEEMKKRMAILEVALGLRPPMYSNIFQVAQETEYTWISEGLRITITQEDIRVNKK